MAQDACRCRSRQTAARPGLRRRRTHWPVRHRRRPPVPRCRQRPPRTPWRCPGRRSARRARRRRSSRCPRWHWRWSTSRPARSPRSSHSKAANQRAGSSLATVEPAGEIDGAARPVRLVDRIIRSCSSVIEPSNRGLRLIRGKNRGSAHALAVGHGAERAEYLVVTARSAAPDSTPIRVPVDTSPRHAAPHGPGRWAVRTPTTRGCSSGAPSRRWCCRRGGGHGGAQSIEALKESSRIPGVRQGRRALHRAAGGADNAGVAASRRPSRPYGG